MSCSKSDFAEIAQLCRRRKRGPRANPAKRIARGEEEQRNERAFGFSRKRRIWSLRRRGGLGNAPTSRNRPITLKRRSGGFMQVSVHLPCLPVSSLPVFEQQLFAQLLLHVFDHGTDFIDSTGQLLLGMAHKASSNKWNGVTTIGICGIEEQNGIVVLIGRTAVCNVTGFCRGVVTEHG